MMISTCLLCTCIERYSGLLLYLAWVYNIRKQAASKVTIAIKAAKAITHPTTLETINEILDGPNLGGGTGQSEHCLVTGNYSDI